MVSIDNVINVIKYVKTSKTRYNGKNSDIGYHSFTLNGKNYEGQRNNIERINVIDKHISLKDKKVLDVGCNMGGMLFDMSSLILNGVGIDNNPKSINAANIVKNYNKNDNLQFYMFNLDKEDLSFLNNFIGESVDIILFLSVAMHIKKWKDTIIYCKNTTPFLIFESNGSLSLQFKQKAFLNEMYNKVKEIGNFGNRTMFFCKNE